MRFLFAPTPEAVLCNVLQAGRRNHSGIRSRIFGGHEIPRRSDVAHELYELHFGHLRQLAQIRDFEGLDVHGIVRAVVAIAVQRRTRGSSSGNPMPWKYVGCLVSG